MVLGDGCISVSTCISQGKYPYTKSVIRLKHSATQLDYMKHKQQLLLSIFGGKPNTIGRFTQEAFGKKWEMLQLSRNNKYFRVMKKYMYPYGKKTVTRQVLSYLTDHGLAIWLMDDGSVVVNRNKEKNITSFQFRLATHFSEAEADECIKWFREIYLMDVKKWEAKPGQWNLRWNTTAHKQLTERLKPYIVPFMYYKFPSLLEQERNLARKGE
jgi:hypothetical protein